MFVFELRAESKVREEEEICVAVSIFCSSTWFLNMLVNEGDEELKTAMLVIFYLGSTVLPWSYTITHRVGRVLKSSDFCEAQFLHRMFEWFSPLFFFFC